MNIKCNQKVKKKPIFYQDRRISGSVFFLFFVRFEFLWSQLIDLVKYCQNITKYVYILGIHEYLLRFESKKKTIFFLPKSENFRIRIFLIFGPVLIFLVQFRTYPFIFSVEYENAVQMALACFVLTLRAVYGYAWIFFLKSGNFRDGVIFIFGPILIFFD